MTPFARWFMSSVAVVLAACGCGFAVMDKPWMSAGSYLASVLALWDLHRDDRRHGGT